MRVLCIYLVVFAMTIASVVHAGDGPRTEDVAFRARCDGSEQHYVLLYPEGFATAKPHTMLIALHGHGSDRWQFIKDSRESSPTPWPRDSKTS